MMRQKDKQTVTISEGEGVKFIEVSVDNGETLRGISPFAIFKAITGACQGTPISMKSIARGTMLMVECRSREMAQKLCTLKTIQTPEKSFKLLIRENLGINVKQGAVYMPEIADCEEEENSSILKALKEQNPAANIESFRRLKRKVSDKLVNTGTLVISFRAETLPSSLSCLYFNASVREFFPDPLRCFRCLKFGHTAKFCKKRTDEGLCVNCGQQAHVSKGDKCKRTSSCVHCCSVTHHSASRQCPVFKVEKAIVEYKFKKDVTWRAARTQVLANWPTRISNTINIEVEMNAPGLSIESTGCSLSNEERFLSSNRSETPQNPTIFHKIGKVLSKKQINELDSDDQRTEDEMNDKEGFTATETLKKTKKGSKKKK